MSSLRPVRGTASEIADLLRAWDADPGEPEPLMIETSGSTGRPKRVALSRRALRASADATHERLGGPGQWVLNLPPTYVAGVQVLFRSIRADVEPVAAGGQVDYGEAWAAMSAERRYLALVPTQLYRALEDGFDTRDLARYTAVLIGGGPLAPEVRTEAERAGIRIVQTYGMSETCGGCVYDGVPLDGVEVRTRDGEVQLRGAVLFDGYDGEPERTAAAFDDGWLRTHDLGHLTEDGRWQVDGRADDVILSGGLKIPAHAVEQALEQHPSIRFAFVCGTPDDEWGEVVTWLAVIDGPMPTEDEVRRLLPRREWWPKRGSLIHHVPLLANGKPDRQALTRLALEQAAADA